MRSASGDIIAMLGVQELAAEDRLTVARARKLQRYLSQPFNVTSRPSSKCSTAFSI